jgi:Kef-type K+ transport system membrane component KefB
MPKIPTSTLIALVFIFGLLTVPRALQRFRLPSQLTCFVFGVLLAVFGRSLVEERVVTTLSTFGIASLFLLAGLEVELYELRKHRSRLTWNLVLRAVVLLGIAWLAMRYMGMTWQPAILLGLGVLTPSTGFILDSLPTSGLNDEEQTEVAMDSIAGEIMALLALVVVSQAGSAVSLAFSGALLALLIALTPVLFLFLGKHVVPYAPGSEFSLLVMVGIICAVITQNIGVHYLIGAFVAGLVAGLLKKRMANLASQENLLAVRLFASFFIPFYFFHEGLNVPAGALVARSLLYGVALSVVAIPLRVGKAWLQARFFSHRTAKGGLRVSIALIPTLIFTLVIAGMLHDQFHIADELYGGLLVYAGITTLLPSLVLPALKAEGSAKTADEVGA